MSRRFSLARVLIAVSFLGASLGGNAYAQGGALDAYNRGAAIGAQQAREREEQEIRQLIIQGQIEQLRQAAEERARIERERQLAIEREQKARQEEERRRVEAEEAKRNAMSTGTGFFVRSDGYLVTNHHVIEDKGQFAVRALDGKFYRAQVVARDAKRDLALLKVEGQFPALHVLDSKAVSKGQRVMAIGYPNISVQGNESKVTDGIISSFSGLRNDDGWFQISVPIQGGNSGGPLVNESGSVVGVVVATVNVQRYYSQSGNLPQNVNYAIKSELLLDFLKMNSVSGSVKAPKKISVSEIDRATVLVIAGNNLEKHAFYSGAPAQTAPVSPQPNRAEAPRTGACTFDSDCKAGTKCSRYSKCYDPAKFDWEGRPIAYGSSNAPTKMSLPNAPVQSAPASYQIYRPEAPRTGACTFDSDCKAGTKCSRYSKCYDPAKFDWEGRRLN